MERDVYRPKRPINGHRWPKGWQLGEASRVSSPGFLDSHALSNEQGKDGNE